MKRLITMLLVMTAIFTNAFSAAVVDGEEYYIINDFYGKLLGSNADGTAPSLSAEGKNAGDSYVFIAEKDAGSSYVYLRQKSTNKYLAASGSNDWSVVFESAKASDNRFLWSVSEGIKTRITNKKNTDKRLGCDWNNTEFESVYYNKSAGVMNFWSVIPVKAGKSHDYSNARGTMERDYYALDGQNITLSDPIDLHIYRESEPMGGGTVNITNNRGWVIFDNCTPTNVIKNHLSSIQVDGATAVNGDNVRIAIYLNGAAVIPCTKDETAITAYTETNYGGKEIALTNGKHSDLGTDNNSIRSFKLKRGYMATLASGKNGSGYSRVYVADHADIEVADLPSSLNARISSIHVKRWQYTSKKGFGGASNDAYKLRCGWNYNWDANSTSSVDVEYIPILQHRYWPSMSNVNSKEASTATLSINEPEHSEQHNGCSCNGVMSAWTATTFTPDFQASGSRIGSPAPTDQGWLKEYFGHVDDMAYRCDFAVTHSYWGPNDANGTSGWNNRINSIYNDNKRPLWITEWEYGSSWYSDQSIYNKSYKDLAIKTIEILDALETNSHVERYAYYNKDVWKLHCWYDDGWITPLGEAYRYVKSDFAYKASEQKVPNYWTPGLQKPEVTGVTLANGKYVIAINNGNEDYTNSLIVEAKDAAGEWSEVYSVAERWVFDGSKQKYAVDTEKLAGKKAVRVKLTTQSGKASQSDEFALNLEEYLAQYPALDDMKNLSFDEGTKVSKGVVTYAKDVNSTSPNSGMQSVTGWTIVANGDARAGGEYAWGSKAGFGSADYLVPAKNSEGTTTGAGLAIVSVWTASTQLTQNVLLPAGKYTVTVPVYNVGKGTDISENLLGVEMSDGSKYYAKTKSYPVGKWTTETLEFTLEGATTAFFSIGYVSNNVGSGSSPHLVYDYVQIEREDIQKPEDPTVAIKAATSVTDRNIYTIMGNKVDNISRPGIYIINGKKTLVR